MADASEPRLVPNCCGEASAAFAQPSTYGCFSLFKWVKSTMYSHRAKRYPKLPKYRRDLQTSVPFRTTKAAGEFLLWQTASRRILVFAVGSNIRLLAPWGIGHAGMDGTFKLATQCYRQLFTIHNFVADKLVPVVYCLCKGKDIGA
ncbi:hypothetical protein T4B_4846 [Trichinella pseudospiralis]|uniref:PiggyBac transposable element-derived protein domain-containing protein n=1 Tax=Trichinella pseudospiralis TaxID=6337 RepID=A0A0V1HXE0_TRIPS|nr:hypothetical protein T4A_10953 [Trichinella pseudospiralis]KRZ15089.1 hypothetical protein T4B_4846 [Trichinella pseudospiralis]KRZ45145.1 hypothetical protein T4C_4578 [Trichinella pseudospiralis]